MVWRTCALELCDTVWAHCHSRVYSGSWICLQLPCHESFTRLRKQIRNLSFSSIDMWRGQMPEHSRYHKTTTQLWISMPTSSWISAAPYCFCLAFGAAFGDSSPFTTFPPTCKQYKIWLVQFDKKWLLDELDEWPPHMSRPSSSSSSSSTAWFPSTSTPTVVGPSCRCEPTAGPARLQYTQVCLRVRRSPSLDTSILE